MCHNEIFFPIFVTVNLTEMKIQFGCVNMGNWKGKIAVIFLLLSISIIGKMSSQLRVRSAEYGTYYYLARYSKRLHTPVLSNSNLR